MKHNDKTTPEQGHSANMLLYAVAPQPKLSTDAIALEGAVVSRGNGIGATSETYLMDCIVGMKHYPDKYFDLAVVDPPYGIGASTPTIKSNNPKQKNGERLNVKFPNYTPKTWDFQRANYEYFHELFRVSKEQIIWGENFYGTKFPGPGRIIWDKLNGGSDQYDGEIAYCSLIDRTTIVYFLWQGMFQGMYCGRDISKAIIQQGNKSKNEKRIHPTQKPIALYKWILSNYTKCGDKILDTHLGSGSSRIAAHELGLNFTSFEIDEEYFFAQDKRFIEYQSQLTLFNK